MDSAPRWRRFAARAAAGSTSRSPSSSRRSSWRSSRSHRAVDAAAVNTLKFESDGIFGDNTDGVGLVRDLEGNLGFAIAGKRVLLMGAGGAAQGVMGPLLAARPAALLVGNRTVDKARGLVERFRARAGAAELRGEQLRRARRQPVRSGHQRDLGEPERHRPGVAARSLRGRLRRLRHDVRQGPHAVSGAGAAARARPGWPTASACWWSKPPNPSSCGAACGR